MGKVLGREYVTATPQTRNAPSDGMGTYTPTTPLVNFWASVQPAPRIVIEQLPEGARKSARWVLLPEGVPQLTANTAYRIACSKGELMMVAIVDLSTHSTGLPHKALVCAGKGVDE